MKKFLSLFSLLILGVALVGCEDDHSSSEHEATEHEAAESVSENDMEDVIEYQIEATAPPEVEEVEIIEEEKAVEEVSEAKSDTVTIASYEAYTAERLAELSGSQPFALFFHAEWCHTCRSWESKVKEGLSALPANTVILKADFDTELDLRKEFKITSQSTAIFFGADGEEISRAADPALEVVAQHFE